MERRWASEVPIEEGSGGPQRIARRALHQEVATQLRDMIIEGVLTPGAKVNELRLCEQLGVSRTPLREALRTLATEGLIDLVPSRGAVVRRLTPDDVFDMLEALKVIEPHAAAIGCRRASDETIAELAAKHARMLEHYSAGERLAYYKLNQDIHSDLVNLAANATLAEMHGRIQARLKRIRFIGHNGPGNWAGAVAEHEAMMAALAARDGGALEATIEAHLDATWARVRPIL